MAVAHSRIKVYLNDLGVLNALGTGKDEVRDNLYRCHAPGMRKVDFPGLGKEFMTGEVLADLPEIPERLTKYNSRNNRLLLAAIEQIKGEIGLLFEEYPPDRIGVVMGTSTSGVDETENALTEFHWQQKFPDDYVYAGQEIGAASAFVAEFLNVTGPAYVISTACSSSGKVFAAARGLIELDICDAVITGGADSLCQLTLGGFNALEAIAPGVSNPFSLNRNGINVGEAAAVFVLSRKPSRVELLGVGESSDAHHMSAPHPDGSGARAAMFAALTDADIDSQAVDYINLHGTGTRLNDAMESQAVFELLGENVLCSSTKPLTGHTLGAAGATEAALCWLLLNNDDNRFVAPHAFDGVLDPELAPLNLCTNNRSELPVRVTMSNSFAFGGNNVSVILGRNDRE